MRFQSQLDRVLESRCGRPQRVLARIQFQRLASYTWVIIHEVPETNWMVDRLTLPELKSKLKAEKK
jgi:hypothetical protein